MFDPSHRCTYVRGARRRINADAVEVVDAVRDAEPRPGADDPASVSRAGESSHREHDIYSDRITDIGLTRTASSAGSRDPANAMRSTSPTAVEIVAGSLGSTPNSSALIARPAA